MAAGIRRPVRVVRALDGAGTVQTYWEAACGGWRRHRRALLRAAVVLLLLSALIRLGSGFHDLLWEQGRIGAQDLISGANVAAEMLLAATVFVQLIPGNLVALLPPGAFLVEGVFVAVWGAVLLFLLACARRDCRAAAAVARL